MRSPTRPRLGKPRTSRRRADAVLSGAAVCRAALRCAPQRMSCRWTRVAPRAKCPLHRSESSFCEMGRVCVNLGVTGERNDNHERTRRWLRRGVRRGQSFRAICTPSCAAMRRPLRSAACRPRGDRGVQSRARCLPGRAGALGLLGRAVAGFVGPGSAL